MVMMPIDLKGLQYKVQSDFTTKATSTYAAVRARNIKFTPKISKHKAGYQKSESGRGPDISVVGAKGGEGCLTFEIPLRGGGGYESPFMALAKNIGEFSNYTAGATVQAAPAPTTTVFTLSGIGTLAVGDAVMIQLNGTGTPEIRFITDVDGAAITVAPAFSSAPVSGDVLLDIDTLHSENMTGEITDNSKVYYSFKAHSGQGATHSQQFTFVGCAGSWKINATGPDSIPWVEFSFYADTWVDDGAVAMTQASEATFGDPYPLLGAPLRIDGTQTPAAEFSFDPGIKLVAEKDPGGANGRSGLVCTGHEPKLSFKPYWADAWVTKLTTPTEFQFHIEDVKDVDEGWALFCPKVEVQSIAEGDIDGIASADMELVLNDPGKAVIATTQNIPLWSIACASV